MEDWTAEDWELVWHHGGEVPNERDTTTTQVQDLLAIQQPEGHSQVNLPPNLFFDFSTPPSSDSTRNETDFALDYTSEDLGSFRSAEGAITSVSSESNAASSSNQLLCEEPNCERVFTHLHDLKYVIMPYDEIPRPKVFGHLLTSYSRHKRYHIKPHECLEPGCAKKGVAFSLPKDLIRHQAKHNGRRFYCHYAGCGHAVSGVKGGFTRQDNLKRHINSKHLGESRD